MSDNFPKTLLEITFFKVTFELRLLIGNLASIYRLALIPVRLIMEGLLVLVLTTCTVPFLPSILDLFRFLEFGIIPGSYALNCSSIIYLSAFLLLVLMP